MNEILNEIPFAGRLVLALVYGVVIGIERQYHHKNAGLKTNTLVAVGAAAFAILSYRGIGPSNNPIAIAAGVVSGIGFIGAGVIMRRGGSVQGINSAATLWAAAAMGLAIGGGYRGLGTLITAVIVICQLSLKWVANVVDRYSHSNLPTTSVNIVVRCSDSCVAQVSKTIESFMSKPGAEPVKHSQTRNKSGETTIDLTLRLSQMRIHEVTILADSLSAIEGVDKTSWSQISDYEPGQNGY
jgi:putative Mg2+ transporter-C (MgtC) family protein